MLAAGPFINMAMITLIAIIAGSVMSTGKNISMMTMRYPKAPNSLRLIGFSTSLVAILAGIAGSIAYYCFGVTGSSVNALPFACGTALMIGFDAERRASAS